jgi:hypothetical protein
MEFLNTLFEAFNEANTFVNVNLSIIYGMVIFYMIFLHIFEKRITESTHSAFYSYHFWAVPFIGIGIYIYKVVKRMIEMPSQYEICLGYLIHFGLIEMLILLTFIEWWRKNVRKQMEVN